MMTGQTVTDVVEVLECIAAKLHDVPIVHSHEVGDVVDKRVHVGGDLPVRNRTIKKKVRNQ